MLMGLRLSVKSNLCENNNNQKTKSVGYVSDSPNTQQQQFVTKQLRQCEINSAAHLKIY